MNNCIQYINKLSPLTQEATDDLLKILNTKTYKKGEYLLNEGNICYYLFFVEKGLTKTFFNKKDRDFIMRFFPENTLFTVLDSFLTQMPSNYMIQALEPTTVTYINQIEFIELCKKHHCIETFFRILVSFSSLNMMKRISELLEEDATERHNRFVKENKDLLLRISLGDLSCYLGITQVSLSRIRAK